MGVVPNAQIELSGADGRIKLVTQAKFTRDDVVAAVDAFLESTQDLSRHAWKGLPMSAGPVAVHLGAADFSHAVCDYASQHARSDRVYVWPLCPAGRRHRAEGYFRGTRVEWATGVCPLCREQAERRQAWLDSLPTFAEEHPQLVSFLADPMDAGSRGALVNFRCADCGHQPITWSPKIGGVPMCSWCKARQGAQPGDLVERVGGGDLVRLEIELTDALVSHGVEASHRLGIVTERDRYHVPIVKPDIVFTRMRVALEVDNTPSGWRGNRHDTSEGVADDQHRDVVLLRVGWRVLRIRRPDQVSIGHWPWRIETTSLAPSKLAALIVEELKKPLDPPATTRDRSGLL